MDPDNITFFCTLLFQCTSVNNMERIFKIQERAFIVIETNKIMYYYYYYNICIILERYFHPKVY